MKTPYDINEAKRWFDNAEKAARRAIALVAAGDESAVAKARFQRDKMGELLRWFYHDDPPYYEAAKAHSRVFSYRYFSRKAGYNSPNFLKLVIDGERNISTDSIERFADALGLTLSERRFFANLVAFNQAETAEEKNEAFERVSASRRFRQARPRARTRSLRPREPDPLSRDLGRVLRPLFGCRLYRRPSRSRP